MGILNKKGVKQLNDTPVGSYITPCGIHLGRWCNKQQKKKGKLSQEEIELLEKIPNWAWESNKSMSKPELKPKTTSSGKKNTNQK